MPEIYSGGGGGLMSIAVHPRFAENGWVYLFYSPAGTAAKQRISRLSLIDERGERAVRMAHLACVGSHAINGVAELHSELLKQDVLGDFHALWPEKFRNKTNGVTPRRWRR